MDNTTGARNSPPVVFRSWSAISQVCYIRLLLTKLTFSGWLTAIGWQVYLASVCFLVGTMIQGLIALNVPTYVWQNWHGTLLSIAVIIFSVAFNTVLASRLPAIEGAALVLHVAGFIAIIIPLWVMGPPADPKVVLLEFTNNGGWPTVGLSSMIGLLAPMAVLVGYDCSVHMCK